MKNRIFRSIVLVSAIVFTAGFFLVMGILYTFFDMQLRAEMRSEANYLALSLEDGEWSALERLPQQQQRITLIDVDGTVLYDSKGDAAEMENHGRRAEVQEALEKGRGEDSRYSATLSEKTNYYALRLDSGQVLRLSNTQYSVLALFGGLIQPILILLLGMLILSAIFANRVAKHIVQPINRMDLEHPEDDDVYDELAPLVGRIRHLRRTVDHQLAEAKRQQQEFSLITDNMSEGLLVLGSRAEVLSHNASAMRLLRVNGSPLQQNVLVCNHSEPFRRIIDQVMDGHHASDVLQLGEGFYQIIANPVIREGATAGAVLMVVDITEKMQREHLRREFTANVSHELKTPLTSISGFAEILQHGMVAPEDTQKFAGKIFEEAQHLITLVNDIIKISQLDEGSIPYEAEEVDLYALAQEILSRMQDAAQRAQVKMELQGEPVMLHTVRPIAEEVIYNLCDNAMKYNRPGGSVLVEILHTPSKIGINITDTGIGIPAADQQRVFERFYRVDKSHSKEIGGTGLGLSIVKHGVACLGAQLELASQPEEGTSVTITWEIKHTTPI